MSLALSCGWCSQTLEVPRAAARRVGSGWRSAMRVTASSLPGCLVAPASSSDAITRMTSSLLGVLKSSRNRRSMVGLQRLTVPREAVQTSIFEGSPLTFDGLCLVDTRSHCRLSCCSWAANSTRVGFTSFSSTTSPRTCFIVRCPFREEHLAVCRRYFLYTCHFGEDVPSCHIAPPH